jgi:hypothetical protein
VEPAETGAFEAADASAIVALTVNPPVAINGQSSLATRNDISKSACGKDFFDD